jgi:N-acetylglucosamine-6-phosphate deacetylase
VKTPFNTIITCDAAGLAGLPPGVYDEGGSVAVEILDDGRIVIAGQRQLLAGSGAETDACVAEAITLAGLSLQQAIEMAGRNPARLLGFEEIKLQRGSRADLIIFEYAGPGSRLKVLSTLLAGEVRFW